MSVSWRGPHTPAEKRETIAAFPRAMFPLDPDAGCAIGKDLSAAADAAARMSAGLCAMCATERPPWQMFSALACERCAERHLGIIH